jgi:hypothetical protein
MAFGGLGAAITAVDRRCFLHAQAFGPSADNAGRQLSDNASVNTLISALRPDET